MWCEVSLEAITHGLGFIEGRKYVEVVVYLTTLGISCPIKPIGIVSACAISTNICTASSSPYVAYFRHNSSQESKVHLSERR